MAEQHADDDELLAAAAGPPAGGGAAAHPDDDALLAAAGGAPTPAAPAADDRGFFTKAADTLSAGAHAIGHVVGEGAHEAGAGLAKVLGLQGPGVPQSADDYTRYARAHELARGVDDVTSLGYGQRLADAARRKVGSETPESQAAGQADAANAAPEYRAAGQVAGTFLPNPAGAAGKALGAVAVPVAKAVAPGTARLLSRLAETRVVGPVLAPTVAAGAGAARGLASYEAVAPAAAALSANASGHRLEAAKEAATDPAGLLTSGTLGAVGPTLETAGKVGTNFVENATKAADEYIAKDIVSESKGASTDTARKQMARAADDFPQVIGRDQELRQAIAEARHNDLPKVKDAVNLLQQRINEATTDKPEVYQAIDQALPDQGVKMKDVVKGFKDDIHEWEHGEHGGEDYSKQIADKLKQRLATITGSEAYGAKPTIKLPAADANQLAELQQYRKSASGVAAAELDKQIAALQAKGEPMHEYDPEAVVSTRRLRKLTTDAQNTAFEGEGGLNGTSRYKRALDVAATPSKLLEASLEKARAGAPDAVQRLEVMDRDTHALLAAKAVFDQRLADAKANSIGAGGKPAHIAHSARQIAQQIGGTGGALTAMALHQPGWAAVAGALAAAPHVERAITTTAARLGASPGYAAAVTRLARAAKATANAADFVRQVVPAGISAKDARAMWEAAHPDARAAGSAP